jgi:hypothetical protein
MEFQSSGSQLFPGSQVKAENKEWNPEEPHIAGYGDVLEIGT